MDLTLFILRLLFLGVLWVFVLIVVFALRSDLFGQRVRRLPEVAPAPFPAPVARPAAAPVKQESAVASRLVITGGAKEGLQIDLPEEFLLIGRSSDSGLVIRDDYTSTNHARLLRTVGRTVHVAHRSRRRRERDQTSRATDQQWRGVPRRHICRTQSDVENVAQLE